MIRDQRVQEKGVSTCRTWSAGPRGLLGICGLVFVMVTACAPPTTGSSGTSPVDSVESSPTVLPSSTTSDTAGSSASTAVLRSPQATEAARTGPLDVRVVRDTPYYTSDEGESLLLDVYHPVSGDGYPLVVLFHKNPVFGATKEQVRVLAAKIAQRGAVVVAPTWGRRMSMGDMQAIADESVIWYSQHGPCAVWSAVDIAPAFGANDGRVTVVGEATGVLPAQAVVFGSSTGVGGCLSPPVEVPIEKAILFEADWLLVPDIWDQVLLDDPTYLRTSSYWDQTDSPTSTTIYMLVGEVSAPETVRSLEGETYLESHWIRLRDPSGELANAFASSGGLQDGDMSFTDVTRVVTSRLVDGGWDAQLLVVPGAGHSLGGAEAQVFVADLVFGE